MLFKVFANGCCSDSALLTKEQQQKERRECSRYTLVLFAVLKQRLHFSAWCWNGTPNTPSARETVFTELVFFWAAVAYCFYFPSSVAISPNLLSFGLSEDVFFLKKKENAVTMLWKELFLCSAAFFFFRTEKQIVHAVQFQWPYCGFWQRHRMTVWHLHCSAKIAPAVSPFAFKMPPLLAFYQPSDSGVAAGQAPSSAGLQWCTRHQILRKGEAVWDK